MSWRRRSRFFGTGSVRGISLREYVRFLRRQRLRRWQWITLVLGGVALVLLLVLPEFLRREITARLQGATTADVRLADVDFNPFRGRLVLKRLALTLRGENHPVLTVRELVLNLRLLSLFRGKTNLEEVQLSGLQIEAVQQADGGLNLSRLFPQPPPGAAPPESDLPTLTVEHLRLSAGQIGYHDLTRTPPARFMLAVKDFTTDDLQLQPQGLGAPVVVRLDGTLAGSPLHGEARISWQRTHTVVEAEVDVQQLALVALAPYLRDTLALQRLSGHVGARLHYRYHSGQGSSSWHTLDGALTLERVVFADPVSSQTALDLPGGTVTIEKIDLHSREIRLAMAELHHPKLFFLQTPTGLNWAALARPPDQAAQSEIPQQSVAPAWRFSLQEARLTGGEIVYRDSTWSPTEAITLTPEEIAVQHLGGEADNSPVRFRVRLGEGTLAGEGDLRLSPFALHAQVQLGQVDLMTLRPLLTHTLAAEQVGGIVSGTVGTELTIHGGAQVARISGAVDMVALSLTGVPELGSALGWESGHVELREGSTLVPLDLGLNAQLVRFSLQRAEPGDLSIEQVNGNLHLARNQLDKPSVEGAGTVREPAPQGDSPLSPVPLPLQVQGVVALTNLVLTHAPAQQILLSCYQVQAELNEGSRLVPLDLQVQNLVLEYPYVQLVRTATGRFQLFAPPAADEQAPTSAPAQEPAVIKQSLPSVSIAQTTVRGGAVFFADQTLTPPQTVSWQDVRLDLSDAHYPPPLAAAFALHALNEDGAPIQLQGTIERQGQQTLVRGHGKVEQLSLTRFNSYLEPHLGYTIRNGALSLNFDLLIPGDRLQVDTKVTLHDLGLGGTQGESRLEQQVGLPLSLIIALLKDLNGNITLRLPVAGRLDKPDFQLGGTILQAVRDALIGAVTSPLKLLGAVFIRKGTIQAFTLEPIRFVPGTSQVSGPGKEQLAHLGRFLSQRPELDLRLSGYTGPDDIRVLTDQLVLAQLQDSTPPAEGQHTPGPEQEGTAPQATPQDEVRQFLASQLTQSGSSKALALSAQAAAVLTQLRAQTTIPQPTLDQLAEERVQAVMSDLTTNHTITSARLRPVPERLRGREGAEVYYMIQTRGDR